MKISQLASYQALSQESFSAHKNGVDQTGVAGNATFQKVTFPLAESNTGSYDTANSRFTPKVPGRYLIHASVQVNTVLSASDQLYLALYKNGVIYKLGTQSFGNGTFYIGADVYAFIDMNGTTDSVEVYSYKAVNSTYTVSGGATYTYFQGILVGATKQLTNPKYSNLVEEKIIAAGIASVTFSGLDSSVDGDYILECDIVNTGAVSDDINLFVNGDTTKTNYYSQQYGATTSNAATVTGANDARLVWPPPSYGSICRVNVACNNGFFQVTAQKLEQVSGTTAQSSNVSIRKTATIAKITSLTLSCSGGINISAGSVFRLYRTNGAQQLVSYAPVDITSRTSDYPMRAGEVVTRSFTAATSVPLYVATQEGEYEITIQGDQTVTYGAAGPVLLKPNNGTVAAGAIDQGQMYIGLTSTVAGSAPAVQAWVDGASLTAFPLGSDLCARARIEISTMTKSKTVTTRSMQKSTSGTQFYMLYLMANWSDYTTVWSSLGTITFPFAQTGTIVIKRIL